MREIAVSCKLKNKFIISGSRHPRPVSSRMIFKGFGAGKGRIGTGADQRVVDIGNLDDSGQERNLISAQAVRVTAAVPTFVAAPDDGQHGLQRLERAADLFAARGMTPHRAPLLRSQFACFQEDGIGNCDLADVAQISAAICRERLRGIEA
jgi:hypothetical protein